MKKNCTLAYYCMIIIVVLKINHSTSERCQNLYSLADVKIKKNDPESITVVCSDTDIVIHGVNISLKNIKNAKTVNHENCDLGSLKKVDTLKIFANQRLTIDADFNINKEPFANLSKLVFIAPEWEIVQDRKIDLASGNGKKLTPKVSAASEIHSIVSKHHDLASSLLTAGAFYGIGANFIGGSKLKITADGGNGQVENVTLFELDKVSGISASNRFKIGEKLNTSGWFSEAAIFAEYQSYFRKNYMTTESNRRGMEFLKRLNRDDNIRNLTEPKNLVNELRELEKDSYHIDADVSPFYELLMDRILLHVNGTEAHSKEFGLLKFLYTTILSRKNSIEENLSGGFVVAIHQYLKDLLKKFDDLQNEIDEEELKQHIIKSIKERRGDFVLNLERQKNESKSALDNMIRNELRAINETLDDTMKDLKKDIESKQKDVKGKEKELLEQKHKAFKMACLKNTFMVVDLVCTGLLAAGPYGVAAATVLGAASHGVKALTTAKDTSAQISEFKSATSDVNDMSKKLVKHLNERKRDELGKLKKVLEKVKGEKNEKKEPVVKTDDVEKEINDMYKDLENLKFEKILQLKNDFSGKLKTEGDRMEKIKGYDKKGKYLKGLSKVTKSSILSAGKDVYDIWADYFEESQKANDLIEKNYDEMEELIKFNQVVDSDLLPALQELVQLINETSQSVGERSKVDFDLLRFSIEYTFRKAIEHQDVEIDDDYSSIKKKLLQSIERLRSLVPLLINANSVLQDMQQTQDLVTLLADFNLAPYNFSEYDITVHELETMVHSNILLNDYRLAYQAFEQYAFPFADKYLKNVLLPKKLTFTNDTENSVKKVRRELKNIVDKITSKESRVTYEGNQVLQASFNSGNGIRASFFEWTNKEHYDLISRLLLGEEVILYADISKTHHDYDVVKFNQIKFHFKATDPKRQTELNNLMENFDIKFTHLGNSHYRLYNRTYFIKSGEVSAGYSFKDRGTNHDINYEKLSEGDYLLSPYALWKVQLEIYEGKYKKVNFKQLHYRFKKSVDIQLTGHGSHLRHDASVNTEFQYRSVQLCEI